MDIYSFGLVCLWFLFNEKLHENNLIFDALPDKRPHPLESKKQNGLKETAQRLACEAIEISASQISNLESFFRSCLVSDPENRASDMSALIKVLGAKPPMIKSILPFVSDTEAITNYSRKPFQVCNFDLIIT